MSKNLKKTEQTFKMLGFAHRAQRLTLGMSATLTALKRGKLKIIVIANDLSQNSLSKLTTAVSESHIPLIKCGAKDQLGKIFGRNEMGIVGVIDPSFAKTIKKIHSDS